MSDAKFVLMMFILLVAFIMTISTTLTEAAVMSLLLAWGSYNDYRYGHTKDRLNKYIKSHGRITADMCRESDRHDDR